MSPLGTKLMNFPFSFLPEQRRSTSLPCWRYCRWLSGDVHDHVHLGVVGDDRHGAAFGDPFPPLDGLLHDDARKGGVDGHLLLLEELSLESGLEDRRSLLEALLLEVVLVVEHFRHGSLPVKGVDALQALVGLLLVHLNLLVCLPRPGDGEVKQVGVQPHQLLFFLDVLPLLEGRTVDPAFDFGGHIGDAGIVDGFRRTRPSAPWSPW